LLISHPIWFKKTLFAVHISDTGYFHPTCNNVYHICESRGYPCTNGAICKPGDTPDNYTCVCPTGNTYWAYHIFCTFL